MSLQLANQIAAGEVVERPASVVKELLENAIDAGSRHIQIDIERGGSALIRISDDGRGIRKSELTLAVSRHATSKLATLNELEHIASLGFRGEALASISAVSRLSIQSKPESQQQAWCINTGTDTDFANYHAEPEPAAGSKGTIVEVRELFFNTPGRRKFMRTVKTEFKHIDDVFKRIALSRFDIAFKLSHNKKQLRNLPIAETSKAIEARISKLFSSEFLANSYCIDLSSNHFSQMGTIRIWGWISKPQWYRNQPDWQYFYVNGRFIRDKLINHALRQACQELLPADTYLSYILYLEIDPGQIDVNVHPTKHEVRFRQTRLVHDFIYSALHEVLEPSAYKKPSAFEDHSENIEHLASKPPSTAFTDRDKAIYTNPYTSNFYRKDASKLSRKDIAEHLQGMQTLYQDNTEPVAHTKAQTKYSEAPVMAKNRTQKPENIFGTSLGALIPGFLLSQNVRQKENEQLFVFQILKVQQFLLVQAFQYGAKVNLLIPQTVKLNPKQVNCLMASQLDLELWGLDISQIADDSVLLRALPSLQGIPGCKINPESLLENLSSWLSENNEPSLHNLSEPVTILVNALETEPLTLTEQAQLLVLLSRVVKQFSPVPMWNKQPLWQTLDADRLAALFK